MRASVVGSAVVHGALTLGLFALHPTRSILVPGPDVVQVALVETAPAVAPPTPAATPRAPESVPAPEEKGVRIERPKRAAAKPQPEPVVAKPAPAPPPPPPTAAPRVVLPYAAIGGGFRGQVAVDESNFEFAYYLQQVRVLIARNWSPPAGGAPGMHTDVYFRVSRDGSLTAPRVEVSSGNDYFDQSAMRAVILTDHLPPLPLGYSGSDLGIHFGFEYSGS